MPPTDSKQDDALDPRPTPAGYPFDHPNADIVLRSSDDKPTDFYVFKLLLTLASPFFELLLSLPQPLEGARHDIPVVEMAEDKVILNLILRFCLPISMVEPPRLSSLRELQMVLGAAMKLEMQGVQDHLRKELVAPRFIETQPLRVFAIACHYGWLTEAKRAARLTLRQPRNTPFIDELQLITAATYYRLQEYQNKCGEIAASRVAFLARDISVDDDDTVWSTCLTCSRAGNARWWRSNGNSIPGVRKWWVDWMDNVAKELQKIPWGETVKKWDLMEAAITKAKECSYCGKRASEDLDLFSGILAGDVEKHISAASPRFCCSQNTLVTSFY